MHAILGVAGVDHPRIAPSEHAPGVRRQRHATHCHVQVDVHSGQVDQPGKRIDGDWYHEAARVYRRHPQPARAGGEQETDEKQRHETECHQQAVRDRHRYRPREWCSNLACDQRSKPPERAQRQQQCPRSKGEAMWRLQQGGKLPGRIRPARRRGSRFRKNGDRLNGDGLHRIRQQPFRWRVSAGARRDRAPGGSRRQTANCQRP